MQRVNNIDFVQIFNCINITDHSIGRLNLKKNLLLCMKNCNKLKDGSATLLITFRAQERFFNY